ncbi:MAG: hypothetical protein WKG32_19335 [Gemmatimonadaceae bacterium]
MTRRPFPRARRLAAVALAAAAAVLAAPLAVRAQRHAPPLPETTSLLGKPLYALPDTTGAIPKADSALARHPRNIDTLLAAAAARAGLWRYRDAIALYTKGMAIAPRDARLYRFRGHRYISLRRFGDAVRDLRRGWQLDSMSYDIAYHLGLAYYMQGDFKRAAAVLDSCMGYATNKRALAMDTTARRGFKSCTTVATNDDDRVGMAEWRYRALLRAGRAEDARRMLEEIPATLQIGESGAYYQDLLISKGAKTEAAVLDSLAGNVLQRATVAYGIAVRHLVAGDTSGARAIFEENAKVSWWPAFGVIGSEVELAKRKK